MLSFTADTPALLAALTATARFATKGNSGSSPIRDCILLTVGEESLTLHASDPALGFTSNPIPCVVKGQGAICLPAAALLAAVKAVGDGAIAIVEAAGPDGKASNRVAIKAPGVAYTLVGMSAADYPARHPAEGGESLSFKVADILRAFAAVSPSIAPDDNRYGLNGVHMELRPASGPTPGLARLVSTDGNRLSFCDLPFAGTVALPPQSLFARVGVAALANLLADADGAGDVTFTPSKRYVEVGTPAGTMFASFLSADFPDYRQVLPADGGYTQVVFNRANLLRAVDRALPFAGGTFADIVFTLTPGEDVKMASRKLDSGDAMITVEAVVEGDAVKLGLNGRYLRDALSTMACDTVRIAFSRSLGPVLIVADGEPVGVGASRLAVVMPLRLD